mgnify:CR=1 FL=1
MPDKQRQRFQKPVGQESQRAHFSVPEGQERFLRHTQSRALTASRQPDAASTPSPLPRGEGRGEGCSTSCTSCQRASCASATTANLANRGRVQRIAALKARLGEPDLPPLREANPESKEGYDPLRCPHCGQSALKLIAIQRGRARNKAPPPANP